MLKPFNSLSFRSAVSIYAPGCGRVVARAGVAIDKARASEADAPGPAKAPRAEVFASRDDPDYKALEAYLVENLSKHARRKEYWQEGFVPGPFYTYEMKRYGRLEEDWTPLEPIDYFQLEERYYKLFYQPRGSVVTPHPRERQKHVRR